jgi:biotin carboxyl carrier protein
MLRRYAIEAGGQEHEITVEPLGDGRVRLCRAGVTREFDVRRINQLGVTNGRPGGASTWSLLEVDTGAQRIVDVEGRAPELGVTLDNITAQVKISDARLRSLARSGGKTARRGPQAVASPMPGKVVRLLVRVGDEITAGQGVAVVEAMKMENELKAPRDGKVVEVRAKEGQTVESSETLVMLE